MEKLATMVGDFDDLMRDVDTLRRFNIAAGTNMHITRCGTHACTPDVTRVCIAVHNMTCSFRFDNINRPRHDGG